MGFIQNGILSLLHEFVACVVKGCCHGEQEVQLQEFSYTYAVIPVRMT